MQANLILLFLVQGELTKYWGNPLSTGEQLCIGRATKCIQCIQCIRCIQCKSSASSVSDLQSRSEDLPLCWMPLKGNVVSFASQETTAYAKPSS